MCVRVCSSWQDQSLPLQWVVLALSLPVYYSVVCLLSFQLLSWGADWPQAHSANIHLYYGVKEQPKHKQQNPYSGKGLCVLIFKHKKRFKSGSFRLWSTLILFKMLWDNVFHCANCSILFKIPITVLLSTAGNICVCYYRSHDSSVMFCSCLTVAGSWLCDSTIIQTDEHMHAHTSHPIALQNLRKKSSYFSSSGKK